ncbi:MAG: dihydroorotate dehydrogenase electron transfer subunit [Victivallaceae bacterium]|nr:dihydroorotate dehydrogenase electron transfer subunit [Victivallaceae bacterium]
MKNGEIIANTRIQGDYYRVVFHAPEIAASAQAGQFVHVRISDRLDRVLRRPFSIHRVEADGSLEVVYKTVGAGTRELAQLRPGTVCDLLGPQGRSFTTPGDDVVPVLVAGGYGAAATYMMTRQAVPKGVLLLGARSKADVILVDEYRAAGYDVRISTDDGSLGGKGRVTELIDGVLHDFAGRKLRFYGCGPFPMLMALAKELRRTGQGGELSIDHVMCCGVGACFACVVKVKADTPEGWRYARACSEGPVFDLEDVYVE